MPPPVLDSHARFIRRIGVCFISINKSIIKVFLIGIFGGKKIPSVRRKNQSKNNCVQVTHETRKPKHSNTSLTDWSKKPRSEKSAAQKTNTNLMIVW